MDLTPPEEMLVTLENFVRAGKIRHIAASNFSGWHLMKSLAVSEKYGWPKFVAHQSYYSLLGREYEWELMPLALDQKVGAIADAGHSHQLHIVFLFDGSLLKSDQGFS